MRFQLDFYGKKGLCNQAACVHACLLQPQHKPTFNMAEDFNQTSQGTEYTKNVALTCLMKTGELADERNYVEICATEKAQHAT